MENWLCTLLWRDNNSHKAESRIYYPGVLTLPGVVTIALDFAGTMQALSSAALYQIELSKRFNFAGAELPHINSRVETNLLLFYGNDTAAATFRVPSPRPLSTDMVGPYRNIRLVLGAADVSPLFAALGGNLASVLAPGGAAWPLPLRAGAFTRYRGDE